MGGSAHGRPTGSVVVRAVGILTDAGHEDAAAELARVARSNGVSLDELAAAIVEVSGRRRARVDQQLADVVRLHWSSILPDA